MFRKKFKQNNVEKEQKNKIMNFNILNFTFIINSDDYDFYLNYINEEYVETFMQIVTIIEGETGLILDAYDISATFGHFITPDFINDIPVTEIGNYFLAESCFEVLIIGSNITKIGEDAFRSSAICGIEVRNKNCIIDPTAFNCLSELEYIANENDQFILNNILFGVSKQKSTIIIDDGVTEIASSVFRDMNYLTKVIAPNTLKKVNQFAFSCCPNLKTFECESSSNIVFAHASFFCCNSLSDETKKMFNPAEIRKILCL